MSDIPVKGINVNINPASLDRAGKTDEKNTGFDSVINDALGKVSQVQNDVDKAVEELATGGDITNAVLAIEKADMTFQLMVEIRNKLLTTYEEVMKMQV